MKKVVQLGVIGAMQRACPALTQLWLDWTGVPGLSAAVFNLSRAQEAKQRNRVTLVEIPASTGAEVTRDRFCDQLGVAPDGTERRTMPIYLAHDSPTHRHWWVSLRNREMTEVDGPLEWWWQLHVLRSRGIRAASAHMIARLFPDHDELKDGVIGFVNPTIKGIGSTSRELLVGQYQQPTHLTISLRAKVRAKVQGLEFSLADGRLKARFVSGLLDLAVSQIS